MKYLKIFLGLLLLYSAGKEYASAIRETGKILMPGVAAGILLVVFLCTWLITGSLGGSKKVRIRSLNFLYYCAGSLLLVIMSALYGFISYKTPPVKIQVNGVNVSIGPCMEANRYYIAWETDRKLYCTCLAEKLTASPDIVRNHEIDLITGKLDKVLQTVIKNELSDTLKLEDCLKTDYIDEQKL